MYIALIFYPRYNLTGLEVSLSHLFGVVQCSPIILKVKEKEALVVGY